jgi:GSCFA family protein
VYSKSVLRAAAGEAVIARPEVVYFPAYEIVTGPGSETHFADDRRTVTVAAVKTVVDAMLCRSEPAASGADSAQDRSRALEELARQLAERECEEAMNEPG